MTATTSRLASTIQPSKRGSVSERQGRLPPTASPEELAWEEHNEVNSGLTTEPTKKEFQEIKGKTKEAEPE